MGIPDISYFVNQKTKKNKNIKKICDINQIKKHVNDLISQNQHVLAVDLWFCFCLGLRLPDLKRATIISNDKKYYDMILLKENKNQHHATRCIPSSLKKLVQWSNLNYPMDQKRLKDVSQYCRSNMGGFYILRHSLMTETLAGLMKNSNFRPHSSTETTVRYYVNY